MLLLVLTKNLNQESLTKDLVTFYFNITGVEWRTWFFYGVRSTWTKKGTGLGFSWPVCRFKGGGGLAKKSKYFLPHFRRQGACHAITKSAAPKQIKSFQRMTAWLQNSTKTFIKRTTSDWLGKYLKKLKFNGDRC